MNPESNIFSSIKTHGNSVYNDARRFCDQHTKLAAAREQLKFNLKCKKNRILPKSLRFRSPLQTFTGFQIAKRMEFSYVKCFINDDYKRINNANQLINLIEQELASKLPQLLLQQLIQIAKGKQERHKLQIKSKLIVKFNNL